MRRRIAVMGALSLVMVIAGFAALWAGVEAAFDYQGPPSVIGADVTAWLRHHLWMRMLAEAGAPVVGAGLIVGIGALALAVRAHQVAGLQAGSVSATDSRQTARS